MFSIGKVIGAIELQDNFTSRLEIAATRLDQFQARAERTGARMQSVGMQLTAMSAALVLAGTTSLATFASFERGMNKVQALTNATGQQFEALSNQAKHLGATTQFTAREASDAMGFMAMAGFQVNDVMGAMPSVLQLAASAQMDMGRAADITTNILTGYGLQVEDLGHANDVLVKAFTSANTNLEQLGQAFKYAGPVAKSAGVSFEETAATLALMGNAGIQAGMAGTSLRGALVRLLNPTKQVQEEINRLGLEVKDTAGRLLPLDQIIQQLEPHAEDTGAMMAIFGQRAGPAMAALVGQGSEALRDLTAKLGDSGGVAQRVAETQMKGLMGAWIALKSAAEGLQIALGEKLGPAAAVIVLRLTDLARFSQNVLLPAFVALPMPIQATALGLLALAAAAGPALLALGSLIRLSGIAAEGFVALVRWSTILGNTIPVLTVRIWAMEASAQASLVTTRALAAAKLYWSGVLTTLSQALGVATARTVLNEATERTSTITSTALATAKLRVATTLHTLSVALGIATARTWLNEAADKASATASALLAAAKTRLGAVLLATSLHVNVLTARLGLMTVAQRAGAVAAAVMGTTATAAAGGVTLFGVALGTLLLAVPVIALLGGIAAAAPKAAEGLRNLLDTVRTGEWGKLFSQDGKDNWLRRWLGMETGVRRTKVAIEEAARAFQEFEAAQQRGMDRLTGVDLTRQANDIGLNLAKLNEQGKLTPAIVKKAADELKGLAEQGAKLPAILRDMDGLLQRAERQVQAGLQNKVNELGLQIGRLMDAGRMGAPDLKRAAADLAALERQGATLPPRLATIVREFGHVATGASQAAKSTVPFSDAIARLQKELAGLSAAARKELTVGALNFSFEEFSKKAEPIRKQFDLSEDALRKFYDQVREGGKAAEQETKWIDDFREKAKRLETQLRMAADAGLPMTMLLEEFGSEIEKIGNRAPILAHQLGEFTRRAFDSKNLIEFKTHTTDIQRSLRTWREELTAANFAKASAQLKEQTAAWLANGKAIADTTKTTETYWRAVHALPFDTLQGRLEDVTREYDEKRKAITHLQTQQVNYTALVTQLSEQERAARALVTRQWIDTLPMPKKMVLELKALEIVALRQALEWARALGVPEAQLERIRLRIKQLEGEIRAMKVPFLDWLPAISAVGAAIAEIGTGIGEVIGGEAGRKWAETAQAIGQVAAAFDQATRAAEAYAKAETASEKIAALAQGAAAVWQATGTNNSTANVIGGMATGAQVGFAVGGPIGAGIGAGIGLGIALWRNNAEWKKVMKDIGRDWGVTISEELAKAIAVDSKRIGRLDAPLLHLDKIFAEAGGVESFGLDQAIAKTRQLFDAINRGTMTAAEATAQLGNVFGDLATEALKTGGIASAEFLELITLSRQFGLNVKEVNEHLKAQVAIFTAGATTRVDAFYKSFGLDKVKELTDKAAKEAPEYLFDNLRGELASIDDQRTKLGADKAALKTGSFTESEQARAATIDAEIARLDARSAEIGGQIGEGRGPQVHGVEEARVLAELEAAKRAVFNTLGGDREAIAEEYGRMGLYAGVSFAETLRTEGFQKAVDAAGPMFDQLREIREGMPDLGLELTGVGAAMAGFYQTAKDNADVMQALDGLQQMIVGSGNALLLNQDLMTEFASDAATQYTRLTERGVDANLALVMMQPTLQALWEGQDRFGLKVNETTQALIDQGIEQGIVGEAGRDANQQILSVLIEIARVLGADIPAGLDGFAQKAKHVGDDAGKGLADGIEQGVLEAEKRLQAEEAWKEYQRLAKQAGTVAGSDLHDALQTQMDALKSEFGDIWATFGRSAKRAGQEAADAVNRIPRTIDIRARWTMPDLPDLPDLPDQGVPGSAAAQAATGGLVTATTILPFERGGRVPAQYLDTGGTAVPPAGKLIPFVPRGTDTVPAMLTPGEGVLTVAAMQRLEPTGLAALNKGEPLPAHLAQKLTETTAPLGSDRVHVSVTDDLAAPPVRQLALARAVMPALQAAAATILLLAGPGTAAAHAASPHTEAAAQHFATGGIVSAASMPVAHLAAGGEGTGMRGLGIDWLRALNRGAAIAAPAIPSTMRSVAAAPQTAPVRVSSAAAQHLPLTGTDQPAGRSAHLSPGARTVILEAGAVVMSVQDKDGLREYLESREFAEAFDRAASVNPHGVGTTVRKVAR